jgi:cytochrome c-type biogenesis protein CcmH
VAGAAVAVVLIAAAGYAWKGSPEAWGGSGPGDAFTAGAAAAGPAAAGSAPHTLGSEQIAAMVDGLAAKLKTDPSNAEGWAMLGRSLTVLGRHDEAVTAYGKAVKLRADDAVLRADYADALAVKNGRRIGQDAQAQIDAALKIDPQQFKALALAGTAAFDREDWAGAARHWQGAVDNAPAGSPMRAQLQASLDEARSRAGLPPATPSPSAAGTAATATAGAGLAAADRAITGRVSLAQALAGKASPDDTVFIYARPADGSRMPLAILRKQVKDLPADFRLDDGLAMSPAAKLSGARQVVVSARVSKSGQATPQPGDLEGVSATVAPGAHGVKVEIDAVK